MGAVDHAAALKGRAGKDLIGPTRYVFVAGHIKELCRIIEQAFDQGTVLWCGRDICDGIAVSGQKLPLCQVAVEHIELAFRLH